MTEFTIKRSPAKYAEWWAGLSDSDQEEITDATETVKADAEDLCEMESSLHYLMTVLMECGVTETLDVAGLRSDVEVQHLFLDIEPAYDGEGIVDGVSVSILLSLGSARAFIPSLLVDVYMSKASYLKPPGEGDDVAWLIDEALAYINTELAERDTFNAEART